MWSRSSPTPTAAGSYTFVANGAGFKTSKRATLAVSVVRSVAKLVAAMPGIRRGEAKGCSVPARAQRPFTVEEHPMAFVVRSAERQQLAWSIRATLRAGDLTRDEERRIAARVAKMQRL